MLKYSINLWFNHIFLVFTLPFLSDYEQENLYQTFFRINDSTIIFTVKRLGNKH